MAGLPTAAEIARDATWLAQALDVEARQARLVRMTADSYRAASFLDDRILAQPQQSVVLPWADVAAAVHEGGRADARWIFHIGHVGSTLVARLLAELEGVLAIREPRILRDLGAAPADQRTACAGPIIKLLSRTFGADQVALVKATSFVSEIASQLVAPGERALFLYARPRAYIASILAGVNSVKELEALAPSRARRMSGRLRLPAPTDAAETAAAAWACEMTALEAAAERMPDRQIAWADFDQMLEDLPNGLARVARLFGFPDEPEQLRQIGAGPLTRRYSKALEYEYSPSLRRDIIAEAAAINATDIDRALPMLQSAAENSPLLARALDRAKEP